MAANNYWQYDFGGSDYQCVSFDPEWSTGSYNGGHNVHGNRGGLKHVMRALLYGSEFEEDEYFEGAGSDAKRSPIDKSGVGLDTIDNHDIPCVMCHVTTRTAMIMIPGLLECPDAWTKEYGGFLMAEGHNQYRSSYICVSERPQVEKNSAHNIPESTAYFVEAECGVLPCNTYPKGNELTCVVCTR